VTEKMKQEGESHDIEAEEAEIIGEDASEIGIDSELQ
jgi:hypothetical protein